MTKEELLQKYFGYSYFKEEQIKIIDAVVTGHDAIGILPTGYGKSVTFQIPALMLEGITLVISPLIALMADQVIHLKEKGISAEYINSLQSSEERNIVYSRIRKQKTRIIYVSGERLENHHFIEEIKKAKISLIVCDEAHTLLWSEEFRVALGHIPDFFEEIGYRPPVLALTATATDATAFKIKHFLGLKNPLLIRGSVDRKNIFYRIIKTKRKIDYVIRYISKSQGKKGIIYSSTIKECEMLKNTLEAYGFSVGLYHGKLEAEEKKKVQELYANDEISIMVCTNAFGMGIDLPTIRYVIEYSLPATIEDLSQQTGRASRDGKYAEAIILYNYGDVRIINYFIDNIDIPDKKPSEIRMIQRDRRDKLDKLIRLCESSKCVHQQICLYFNEKHKGKCGMCSNCKKNNNSVLN